MTTYMKDDADILALHAERQELIEKHGNPYEFVKPWAGVPDVPNGTLTRISEITDAIINMNSASAETLRIKVNCLIDEIESTDPFMWSDEALWLERLCRDLRDFLEGMK